MAVLRIYALEDDGFVRPKTPSGRLATLQDLLWQDLPADVRDRECTITVLFRASQVLNFVTGGTPQMTFSARCHRRRRTARTLPGRAAWTAMELGIDTACGVLRGETRHCATAWSNYIARDRGVRRTG